MLQSQSIVRPPPAPVELPLKLGVAPELSCAFRDLRFRPEAPAALDERELSRFLDDVITAERDNLQVRQHGFILAFEPLVALFRGQTRDVRRTACVPVADPDAVRRHDVLTFPEREVLEIVLPSRMSIDAAVSAALERCRVWSLEAEDHRVGNFIHLHLVPDARGRGATTNILRVQRLSSAHEDS